MKSLLREWIPPALLRLIRQARGTSGPPEWEYRPGGWQDATGELRGWDAPGVSAAQRANWQAFVDLTETTGPLGINHTDLQPNGEGAVMHNNVMTFAYALALAADGKNEVSLLDWGGGAGHYYRFARALLPGKHLNYECREVPSLCLTGEELNPGARFVPSDQPLPDRKYDLVLASGSLHYSRDWRQTLAALAKVTGHYLLLTRQPTVWDVPSFVVVQRAYGCGYDTEYQGWFLNHGEILNAATAAGLQLQREFVVDEHPEVPGAPEACRYRGFLFVPTAA